jgi:6-phosphogluconate dehydrogenase
LSKETLKREPKDASVLFIFSFSSLGEAVFARCLSSLKDERVEASKQLKGPAVTKYSGDKKEFVEHIRKVWQNKWCNKASKI